MYIYKESHLVYAEFLSLSHIDLLRFLLRVFTKVGKQIVVH